MNPDMDFLRFVALAGMILLGFGLGVILLRAIWRFTNGLGGRHAVEFDQLRARMSELEADRGRMAELEERLDFAERLLARQAEIDRLAGER
ncbi:MAG TPA: hypothetical protein VFI13_14050 [Gemmatimonadales bacterium]|nr:hypothetical protein [Gemmatimonadales bacterium]